jgi:hypothetical protein
MRGVKLSFSVSVQGKKGELEEKAEKAFNTSYSEPAPGVRELAEVGFRAVADFAVGTQDEGDFSLFLSGHAHQGNDSRDWLTVNIQPAI